MAHENTQLPVAGRMHTFSTFKLISEAMLPTFFCKLPRYLKSFCVGESQNPIQNRKGCESNCHV